QFDIPAASIAARRLSLQPDNLVGKKATVLQHGETNRPRPGPQPQRDTRKGPASAARTADHVEVISYLCRNLGAAPDAEPVTAALWHQIEAAELFPQPGDDGRIVLVPVGATVEVGQPHAVTHGVGQRVVQRPVLLTADDADGSEAEVFT